jgi:hypothetical protein
MIETPLGTVRFSGSPRFGRVTPALPPDYPAVTATAAVWRLAGPTAPVTCFAYVTDVPADAHGGADSGERLDAMTFEGPAGVMSFGGPDSELLHAYAREGTHLPKRWATMLSSDGHHVDYEPAGIGWRLPDLARGESLTLCVVVAWSAPTDHPSTWYAVDMAADQVLAQLG